MTCWANRSKIAGTYERVKPRDATQQCLRTVAQRRSETLVVDDLTRLPRLTSIADSLCEV